MDVDHAFALMARLYPQIDAFTVLKTTEGLECIPAMLAVVAGVVSFSLGLSPYHIALYVAIASVFGMTITLFGLFFIPGLPKLGTLYSYISGFGIATVLVAVYGFIAIGWQGVIAFLTGRFIAWVLSMGIEFWNTRRIHSKTGVALTLSEINFFNAYRLHASQIRKPIDVIISDEELRVENWKGCFDDLALKWPEVVSRFTVD